MRPGVARYARGLPPQTVGDGMLLYAAKVKIEKGKLDIEYVGMEPIRLTNLRKLAGVAVRTERC